MDLLHLEQQRQALEANLQSLRQNLRHWQTWEAEYEGLKEELAPVNGELTPADIATIASTYTGDLVNEKEIRELANLDRDSPRTAKQIVGLVERRQEYVQKNIETVQRQYFDAEAKQEELAFVAANQSDDAHEPGLPLTEIHEELDEEGNVVSSRLNRPEESTAKVIESLKKAGLDEDDLSKTPEGKPKVEELKPAITNASPPLTSPTNSFDKLAGKHEEPVRPSVRKKSVSFTADTKVVEAPRSESEEGKKSVSFNEKVAVMPAAPPPDPRSVSFSPKIEEIPPQDESTGASAAHSDEQKKLRESFKPGEKVVKINEKDEIEDIKVVLPENESPEDARTRREMLEYSLNEVNNVVAQIDLDEETADLGEYTDDEDDGSSYFTTSEYPEDEDTPYTTGHSDTEDEEEDEYGRSTKRVLSDAYVKEMQALEKKLIGNLGPKLGVDDDEEIEEVDPEDAHRLVIREKRNSTSSQTSENSDPAKPSGSKKRVSFASALDVASPSEGTAPPAAKAAKQEATPTVPPVAPVASSVAERNPTTTTTTAHPPAAPQPADKKKPSRFKQARTAPLLPTPDTTATPPGTYSGTPGTTLAPTLLERTTHATTGASPAPPSLDVDGDGNTDDSLLRRRELAAEYYRQRDRLVRAQGGFLRKEGEGGGGEDGYEDRDEVTEGMVEVEGEGGDGDGDGNGRVRKVSRWRGARVSGE